MQRMGPKKRPTEVEPGVFMFPPPPSAVSDGTHTLWAVPRDTRFEFHCRTVDDPERMVRPRPEDDVAVWCSLVDVVGWDSGWQMRLTPDGVLLVRRKPAES